MTGASGASGTPRACPRPLRVLLCDDNETLRAALRDIVAAQPDMECVGAAADAAEAIALALRNAPDVVVMDVRFPGGGAYAAGEIARRLPGARLVAFSAYADGGSMTEMRAAGVDAYLTKGVSNAEFLGALRRAGASHR